MQSETFTQTIVYGVGLLGGSVGLAAKRARVGGKIVGVGRSIEKLTHAVEVGAIDVAASSWRDAFEAGSSEGTILIVFAAPVDTNLRALRELWALRDEPWTRDRNCVISDVGSVKFGFAQTQRALEREQKTQGKGVWTFLPAHPIAGSDRSGVDSARAELFDGKLTILTPWASAQERQDAVARGEAAPSELSTRLSISRSGASAQVVASACEFWRALGCRLVVETSAEEHDQILARTSHLPNLASVLTTSVVPLDELLFTGTGFRDVTRLSGGNPFVWTEIFGSNRVATLEALERLEEQIVRWKTFLQEDDRDSILTFLQDTKKKRDALGS